jgi:hypothetical protein
MVIGLIPTDPNFNFAIINIETRKMKKVEGDNIKIF